MAEPTVEIKRVKAISTEEAEEIQKLLTAAFEADVSTWSWSPDDWRVLVRVGGKLVSLVCIVEKTCLVKAQPVNVGGVGGVSTLPDWQGKGLASLAMQKTAEFMTQQLKADFGVLFCSNDMVPYYQRLGWRTIDAPVFFDSTQGKMQSDSPVMYLPGLKPYWPSGSVDVCGSPW